MTSSLVKAAPPSEGLKHPQNGAAVRYLEEPPGVGSTRGEDILEGGVTGLPPNAAWVLRGVVDSQQYATQEEQEALLHRQPPLGRPTASRAALIPDHQVGGLVAALSGGAAHHSG